MKNGITKVQSSPKLQAIIRKAKADNIFVVELDGFAIQTVESFLEAIEEGFQFPVSIDVEYFYKHMVIEDLRHLEWLDNDGYMIVINNYKDFLKRLPKIRHDAVYKCLGHYAYAWGVDLGKPLSDRYMTVTGITEKRYPEKEKPFTVYLVD
jgi:hypothetical protein